MKNENGAEPENENHRVSQNTSGANSVADNRVCI